MRLLYVEDEPALLQVTAKRLKAEGYGVDTCANGTEALDYIALTDYDAVILDIMLPGRTAFPSCGKCAPRATTRLFFCLRHAIR